MGKARQAAYTSHPDEGPSRTTSRRTVNVQSDNGVLPIGCSIEPRKRTSHDLAAAN